MKALIYDFEVTDMDLIIKSYSLKNYIKYFKPDTIERDWTILSGAWLPLEGKKPTVVAIDPKNPFDDEQVIRAAHEALNGADLLIGHNSDNFDYKKFNTRALYHGLPPISPKLSVDTLKLARKYFAFSSNSLRYIANYLGVSCKDNSPDWEKIKQGNKKEISYMKKYNGQDCIVTRDVYLKLRSFHHTHPKNPPVRDIAGEVVNVCPKCGNPESKKVKVRHLSSGRTRRQFQCKGCFGYWTTDLIK